MNQPLKDQSENPEARVERESSGLEPRDEAYRTWIFTIPNVICMIRLIGSLVMVGLAVADYRQAFVALFVVLTLSDWIDGWLARSLHQRSDFGARLDSFADAALYTALLCGIIVLATDELREEFVWISVALASYVLTTGAGIVKYGRVPSYHTFAAKKSQGLVLLAGILLVLQIVTWPTRVAAVAVTLTNIEATLLTFVLPTWQADVSSLYRVLRDRRTPDSDRPAN